ncbi:MAG: hypothetical protein ACUVT2_01395 [Thiobacillaceae bacterium]
MLRPLRLFLLLLLLFPALTCLVAAWRTGFADLTWWQWLLIALLPGLAWLWLRHFSVLGLSGATGLRPEPESVSVPTNNV